jgi:hypothetical protein
LVTIMIPNEDWEFIIDLIKDEVFKSREKHGKIKSPHEGFALIKEELDELWNNVKSNISDLIEPLQIAALAISYIFDIIELRFKYTLKELCKREQNIKD